jgi:hypothetical protein
MPHNRLIDYDLKNELRSNLCEHMAFMRHQLEMASLAVGALGHVPLEFVYVRKYGSYSDSDTGHKIDELVRRPALRAKFWRRQCKLALNSLLAFHFC